MQKVDLERAYNEIVNSGYGFNQCHESTMRTAAKVLSDVLVLLNDFSVYDQDKEGVTLEDLYRWAMQNDYEHAKIRIQYRDDGGNYNGLDNLYCWPPNVGIISGESCVIL